MLVRAELQLVCLHCVRLLFHLRCLHLSLLVFLQLYLVLLLQRMKAAWVTVEDMQVVVIATLRVPITETVVTTM